MCHNEVISLFFDLFKFDLDEETMIWFNITYMWAVDKHLQNLYFSIMLMLYIDKQYFLFLVSVSLNSVVAVLDADFHSLPSVQHRQQYGPVCYC
jgi:hypothetical protein